MKVSRRELIKLGLYSGAVGLLHLSAPKLEWALGSANHLPPSPASVPFRAQLPIPPAKVPVDPATLPGVQIFNDGFPTRYYEITMRPALAQIFPTGPATAVWGYDGLYPGPTIKERIGSRTVVRQHNKLPVETIVHHHGAHSPSDSDGSALVSELIPPSSPGFDSFRDYLYPNDDESGTTHWYHDHAIDFTGHNVYMGLAAFYLLDDDEEDLLNLPGNVNDPAPPGGYPFDISLVLQDRVFDANNQLVYNPFNHDGFLGDKFLVNGAIQPRMQVANRKYRFRVLNGSNARWYQLAMSNGMPFQMIGNDGGLLFERVDVSNFRIGMAERYEFILDFSEVPVGSHVYLNNIMQQTSGRGPDGVNPKAPTPLMRFDVAFSVPDPSSNPVLLHPDIPVFDPALATQTINLEFQRSDGAWQINGRFFDPARIDFTVKLNSTVLWHMKNGGGGWYHPIHIHRNQFRILTRNGQPPHPVEAGLKDVFALAGGDDVVAITTMTGAVTPTGTDALGPYVFHCHNLEHEDMRMMGIFNVVP